MFDSDSTWGHALRNLLRARYEASVADNAARVFYDFEQALFIIHFGYREHIWGPGLLAQIKKGLA
jgi:hypothetical protein